ncbi:hypothetical protein EV401DRAFT_1941862 [Pisolithus croceorrhizus]|nr:hypothetical protein EV401DRAFT_1941862 [Pisolithus croceorrhizus]
MSMLYGEGKNAFRRLQLEIIPTSNDQNIFSWGWRLSFLNPSYFQDCSDVVTIQDEFMETSGCDVPKAYQLNIPVKRLRTSTVPDDGIRMQGRIPLRSVSP